MEASAEVEVALLFLEGKGFEGRWYHQPRDTRWGQRSIC